jgi:hypothetical protein
MNEELNIWDFESDIKKIPARTKKISSKRSREIAGEVFNKYKKMIYWSFEDRKRDEKKAKYYRCLIEALKKGVIIYGTGSLLVSEIREVSKEESRIVVTLKNGDTRYFSLDFEWILDIF